MEELGGGDQVDQADAVDAQPRRCHPWGLAAQARR
jgi:hypothetical protein